MLLQCHYNLANYKNTNSVTSVILYKERNKNNQTKTLKINIEVSDSEIQKEKKPHSYAKTSRTDKLYSFNNKENNHGISNLKTVRKEYKPSSTRKHMGNITPRNAKYPPKYSPSDLEVSKSLNLVVHTKGRRTRHRRNISSGYYPFCVTKKDSTEGKVHGSLLQYKKTSVQKLENDEASNFNLDDMDEASSQCVFRDDVSDSQHKNPDPSVYSAKYSYKSYMKKDSSNIEQRDKVQKGFKTYELK